MKKYHGAGAGCRFPDLESCSDRAPVKAFSDRMLALSVAHDVLLQQNWNSALVGSIVENAICTFSDIGRV